MSNRYSLLFMCLICLLVPPQSLCRQLSRSTRNPNKTTVRGTTPNNHTCNVGFWGQNCKNICNCTNSGCNQITGECRCNAGYVGDNCENYCQNGTFGENCSEKCTCSMGDCHHVTGACICLPGYTGYDCSRILPKVIVFVVGLHLLPIITAVATALFVAWRQRNVSKNDRISKRLTVMKVQLTPLTSIMEEPLYDHTC